MGSHLFLPPLTPPSSFNFHCDQTEDVLQNPNTKRDYGHSQLDTFQAMLDVVITLGALLVGLVFTVVIYRAPKIKRKSAILHIAESVFLIFIIFMGGSFGALARSFFSSPSKVLKRLLLFFLVAQDG